MASNEKGALPTVSEPNGEAGDLDRRLVLRRLGGYAASVAPAMVVLTSGAHAARGGNGNGRGNGNDNGPQAPCDNPAWDLGLSRAGHSGC